MQTEEQGFMYPPPPPLPVNVPAGQGFASQSQPQSLSQPQPNLGSWGMYPYYDFMFLTGQYPPGTITYSSQSSEQGSDSWQDVHYVKESAPYNPGPAGQAETFTSDFTAPQTFDAPRQPAIASYGPGGAQPALQPASSYGRFTQPGRFDAPTHGQAGGYNLRKI
ncbi:uncharacterized protein [Chaetodon trifascialis]|uniref:uncharacterized protein n=1 Tax=Chaetodon trifascialis TaxID=109706 RepID=UPI00399297E5